MPNYWERYRVQDEQNRRKMKLLHGHSMASLALRGPLTPARRAEALRVLTECERELAEIEELAHAE